MRNQLTLQSESAECGLACIAMVAAAHGHRETLSELRRRFPISLGGSSLKTLIAIADTLGFSARPLRCDLDELKQLQSPAILHWSLDHYVVLRRLSGRHAWIADPARGERKLTLEEVSRHFTGVALELTPAPHFEKKATVERVRLGDLWSRLSGLKRFLIQMFLLTLLMQGIGLIPPYLRPTPARPAPRPRCGASVAGSRAGRRTRPPARRARPSRCRSARPSARPCVSPRRVPNRRR